MATYALWNNKGGVGKSYLTFQIACELLGLIRTKNPGYRCVSRKRMHQVCCWVAWKQGEAELDKLGTANPRAGLLPGISRERISSPYHNPNWGGLFAENQFDQSTRSH